MGRRKTTKRRPGRRRVRWTGRKRPRQVMRIAPCRADVINLDRYRASRARRPQPPTPPAPAAPRARAA